MEAGNANNGKPLSLNTLYHITFTIPGVNGGNAMLNGIPTGGVTHAHDALFLLNPLHRLLVKLLIMRPISISLDPDCRPILKLVGILSK